MSNEPPRSGSPDAARSASSQPATPEAAPAATPAFSSIPLALKYPDRFNDASLSAELARRLAGKPAGSSFAPSRGAAPGPVVWVDAGSEVLVYLDAVRALIEDRLLLVSVDMECDQIGRTALIVALAIGAPNDPAGLLAASDELPRGNGLLAARWGKCLQDAVWSSLLGLVSDYAAERHLAPLGFSAAKGVFQLYAGAPLLAVRPGTLEPASGGNQG